MTALDIEGNDFLKFQNVHPKEEVGGSFIINHCLCARLDCMQTGLPVVGDPFLSAIHFEHFKQQIDWQLLLGRCSPRAKRNSDSDLQRFFT